MKICVLGLDAAAPQVMFQDESLTNIRHLMGAGVYGLLESVVPPGRIPAWACFSASQDPGSLGVYGARSRKDYSYDPLAIAKSVDALTIGGVFQQRGLKPVLLGVPPGEFIQPSALKTAASELVGDSPVDLKNFRTMNLERFKEEVFEMSASHWKIAHRLLAEQEWDYFHFVDIGLDRLQHRFWNHFDHKHGQFSSGNPYQSVIPEYYQWLDQQIGQVFESLDDQTIVLVLSAYGAQRLDGSFAINEWLIREGFLILHEYPARPTPFEDLKIDWSKTAAWSKGGYYASIFFNVHGRESQGVIRPEQYESFGDELKLRLETLCDPKGQPLQALVFKPGEIYRNLRNIAPDLMVQFGGLFWRSIASVGHSGMHVPGTGDDSCNHSEYGIFMLAAPNCPLQGEYEGARLLDMSQTLLDLAGYEIPESMQGKSLVGGMEKKPSSGGSDEGEAQRLIHDRLAGLGYI